MNVNVHFNGEIENALRMMATARGTDVSAVVEELVAEQLCDAEQGNEPQGDANGSSAGGFAERLSAWIDMHPRLDRPVDDSRESIYSGRGE